MDVLSYNSLGQWSLTKSRGELDYKDYRRNIDNQGLLEADHGGKGKLHATSNTQPPRQTSKQKMEGKVPVPTISAYASQNPSLEDKSKSPKIS
jgi:hypothetical protein